VTGFRPGCDEVKFASKIRQLYAWPTERNQVGILSTLSQNSTLYKDLNYFHPDPVTGNNSENFYLIMKKYTGLDVTKIVREGLLAPNLANVRVSLLSVY